MPPESSHTPLPTSRSSQHDPLPPIVPVIQDAVLRGPVDVPDTAIIFSTAGDWRSHLAEIDCRLEGARPLVLASIPVCRFIRQNLPHLRRGVLLDVESTRFSASMSLIERNRRFNDRFFLLPFGEIEARRDDLLRLFGDAIFLRPDSGLKTFPGQVLPLATLAAELASIRQIFAVPDDAICVVAPARPISDIEFRTWLVDGTVAAIAPYAHEGVDMPPAAPLARMMEQVRREAEILAADLEMANNCLVVDFVFCPTRARVVVLEMNAVSTSGLYEGADLDGILRACDAILC